MTRYETILSDIWRSLNRKIGIAEVERQLRDYRAIAPKKEHKQLDKMLAEIDAERRSLSGWIDYEVREALAEAVEQGWVAEIA